MRTPDTHHAHAAGSRNLSARSGVRTNNSRARVVRERGREFPSSQDGRRTKHTVATRGRREGGGRRSAGKGCISPTPPGKCPLRFFFWPGGRRKKQTPERQWSEGRGGRPWPPPPSIRFPAARGFASSLLQMLP